MPDQPLPASGNVNEEPPQPQQPVYVTEDRLASIMGGYTGRLLQQIDQRLEPVGRIGSLLDQYAQVPAPEVQPYQPQEADDFVTRREHEERLNKTLDERDARLRAELRTPIETALQYQQRTQQQMQEDRIWGDFATRHKDLEAERHLVEAHCNRIDWDHLAHLTPDQKADHLARVVKSDIARIRGGGSAATAPAVPQVIPGAGVAQAGITQGPGGQVQTVADVTSQEQADDPEKVIADELAAQQAMRDKMGAMRV